MTDGIEEQIPPEVSEEVPENVEQESDTSEPSDAFEAVEDSEVFEDSESLEASGVPQLPKRKRKWWLIILLVLLAAAAIAAGLFAWDRWWRFDDAADIQGVWHDSNGAQVVIDESRMLLGNRVIYDFTLDTKEKTITYTYDDYVGHASYRFSDDRQVLVLQENATTDWLMALHLKEDPVLLDGTTIPEGCTRLTRQAGNPQELFDAYAKKDRQKTPTTSDASGESGQEDEESYDQYADDGMEGYDDTSYYDDDTYQGDTAYTDEYGEEYTEDSYDQSYDEAYYEDYSDVQEE